MTPRQRARLLCIDDRYRSSLHHKRTYCSRPKGDIRRTAWRAIRRRRLVSHDVWTSAGLPGGRFVFQCPKASDGAMRSRRSQRARSSTATTASPDDRPIQMPMPSKPKGRRAPRRAAGRHPNSRSRHRSSAPWCRAGRAACRRQRPARRRRSGTGRKGEEGHGKRDHPALAGSAMSMKALISGWGSTIITSAISAMKETPST